MQDTRCRNLASCLLLLASCFLFLTSCSSPLARFPGTVRPTVKIGLVAPFEGRYRYIGYEVIYGVRLALREANHAGGVGGYNVELVAYDDGADPTMASEQARKLAVDPEVVTAIGHFRELGVHGIISCDDWGLQDRLFIHRDTFREFFKPRYKRVYDAAHEAGMLTFLHSCGYIVDILDDLIEAGLDVIQMDQQENMGVELLGERFGGRLAFWCPVDIQQTMVHGTLDDIRAYARRLIETLGCYNGGFIAKWYPSPLAVQHSDERIRAMAEAFVEYGQYR